VLAPLSAAAATVERLADVLVGGESCVGWPSV